MTMPETEVNVPTGVAEPPSRFATGLEALPEAELLTQFADNLGVQTWVAQQLDLYRIEVRRRLEARGATAVDHPRFEKVVIEAKYEYDQAALSALKGLLTVERLAEVYTPAHTETVIEHHPEAWNVARVRGLVKLGGQVAEVIGKARRPKSDLLIAKLKPEAPKAKPS